MKTNLLLTLILGIFLMACSSDDDNPAGSGSTVNGTMTSKVDGASWSATGLLVAQKNGASIGITGDDLSGGRDKKIQLNLNGVSATGTYSIGGFSTNMGVFIDIPQGTTDQQTIIQATETATSGSVTVTELTGSKIKGTFSMTTSQGTSITEGNFDVKF